MGMTAAKPKNLKKAGARKGGFSAFEPKTGTAPQ
jgi:hypothetical protein